MDKRDILVLAGIVVGTSVPIVLVALVANGIVSNPIP